MVVKIYGDGFSERKPAPKKTSEQAPAPEQKLIPDGVKAPLVFPGVTLPGRSIWDIEWAIKFDKYATCKKRRKCAAMLYKALKADQFWRIAYALEKRHQDPDPDSVFTFDNKIGATYRERNTFVIGFGDRLSGCLTNPHFTDQAKEMMINGFYPQNEEMVDFFTLTRFHRDTLMTWAEHADQKVLNTIFAAVICAGQIEDIVKLTEMGAEINCNADKLPMDFRTPSRCAISRQNNTVMQKVIDLGANTDSEFNYLMEQAYRLGNPDVVETLKATLKSRKNLPAENHPPQTSAADGWRALSATFAEYSGPKGATGLQVTYQVDFGTQVVNCVYEKDNAVSAPTVIPLSQLNNPGFLQKAADVIEKSGCKRPDTGPVINQSAGTRKITSVNRKAPGR